MTMRRLLDDLADYVRYRLEEGERFVQVSPQTVDALGTPARGARRPAPAQSAAHGAAYDAAPSRRTPTPGPAPRTDGAGGAPHAQFGSTPELDAIAAEITACRRCRLGEARRNVVPGQGTPTPEVAFVGEGPGADEDAQGLAFVGRAGQLLTKMIVAMGFEREEVWIGNVVKCRPPGNRVPHPDEMEACLPYLKAQLALLKPKIIVGLGATAVKGLLDVQTGITKLRGKWHLFEGIDFMPTFHPAYLLRNPPAKKEAWQDLQEVLHRLGRPVPDFTAKSRRK